jgi:hypothetical protein
MISQFSLVWFSSVALAGDDEHGPRLASIAALTDDLVVGVGCTTAKHGPGGPFLSSSSSSFGIKRYGLRSPWL